MEKTKHIKIWLDGDVVDQFDFDFDENMSDRDIKEVIYEYACASLEIEVE